MYFNKRSSVCAYALLLVCTQVTNVFCEQSVIANNEVGVKKISPTYNQGKHLKQHPQQSSFHVSSASDSGSSFSPSAPTPQATAQVANHGNVDEQYRATYFYSHPPHHLNWNRDSYSDAANDFGYNQQQSHQTGAVYAPAYGMESYEGYDDSSLGGGIGGLGGIAGILGLKGLKGLGILAVLKAASPLLLVIIPAIILLPLLLLFFPVPVITLPAGQRSFNLGEISSKMSSLARTVLDADDKCVERISCEISRVSKGSFLDKTLKKVIPKFEPRMPQSLKRIARVYMEGQSSCSKKYSCYLMDDITGSTSSNNGTTKKTN